MEWQDDMLQTGIFSITMDGEAQRPVHLQHGFIFGQHLAVDFLDAARGRSG